MFSAFQAKALGDDKVLKLTLEWGGRGLRLGHGAQDAVCGWSLTSCRRHCGSLTSDGRQEVAAERGDHPLHGLGQQRRSRQAGTSVVVAADPGLGLGGAGAGEGGQGGEDAEPEILLQELPRLAVRRLLQGRLYLTRRPVEGQQILPMYYFLAL